MKVDEKILANMMARVKRFGDLFNGYTKDEIIALLKKYNNCAPDVCLDIILKMEADGI